MQMTPATARSVAAKFRTAYDEKRLLDDETYNAQLGAAELGDLIKYYRGSYVLPRRVLMPRAVRLLGRSTLPLGKLLA
jgi:soluble lytic murein transglycosylase-like protein